MFIKKPACTLLEATCLQSQLCSTCFVKLAHQPLAAALTAIYIDMSKSDSP